MQNNPGILRYALLTLFAATVLSACSAGGAEAELANYLARLQRTLDTSASEPASIVITPPPRSGELQQAIAPGNLDALDFLALRGCDLQTNIGRRNSSLGRMAPPSQQLLLDLEYLRQAPACIAYLTERGEAQLAENLAAAGDLKRQQLPARIFNATLAGPEYRQLWRAARPAGSYPRETSSAVSSALQAIEASSRRWLAGDYAADDKAFEIALGIVAGGDGGELLQALALQQAWLSRANTVLVSRAEQGPLCSAGSLSGQAEILKTVVQKFFVGQIQPWSADLARRYHELLPPIRALEELVKDAAPDSFTLWRQARDTQLSDMLSAPKTHVEHLQDLLSPCLAANA